MADAREEVRDNPMCGPGAYDRNGRPHFLCKHTASVLHYEGIGVDCLITSFCPLYACMCWNPTARYHGDTAPGFQNPCFLSKGYMDREREPHVVTKLCLTPLVTAEYDGCFSLAHCLSFCLGPLHAVFCWTPKLDSTFLPLGSVGAAVMAKK